ncbi:MAG: ABC transporter permease [Planctomycetota bacterium]
MSESATKESEVLAIDVQDLVLLAGGRTLLDRASMTVARGEVVLLVGLSGTGKSLTLRLLLDLLDREDPAFDVSGDIRIFGQPVHKAARERAGIVFQDFGLFDEWDARENIGFGLDHRRSKSETPRAAAINELIDGFDLNHAGRVATLSGGMKQRCALARTLAFHPDLIIYDEPTSGLDPAMSTRVAERIRKTNDEFQKTSLVVTHDLAALAGIANRILLLDPVAKSFREVPPDRVELTLDELRCADIKEPNPPRAASVAARLENWMVASAQVLEAAFRTLWALLPRWPRMRWGLRYLLYYLRLTSLGSALVYVGISGFILGLIVTYFTFSFLPFKQYTEPLLIDRIISAIGFGLYRIMVPGMTAMLVAARSGAAIAADIGNRVYSRQTDALRSFGVAPERYLFTNLLWAQLLGMPLLIAVNFLCARAASLLVFVIIHSEYSTWFWAAEFNRFLGAGDSWFYAGTGWLVAKSLVSALGVGAIAWFQGLSPKESGRDIATAVTRTIIWGTLFVLCVQLVSALCEFDPL